MLLLLLLLLLLFIGGRFLGQDLAILCVPVACDRVHWTHYIHWHRLLALAHCCQAWLGIQGTGASLLKTIQLVSFCDIFVAVDARVYVSMEEGSCRLQGDICCRRSAQSFQIVGETTACLSKAAHSLDQGEETYPTCAPFYHLCVCVCVCVCVCTRGVVFDRQIWSHQDKRCQPGVWIFTYLLLYLML